MRRPSLDYALSLRDELEDLTIDQIMERGLHEFLTRFIQSNNALALHVEQDFRFNS